MCIESTTSLPPIPAVLTTAPYKIRAQTSQALVKKSSKPRHPMVQEPDKGSKKRINKPPHYIVPASSVELHVVIKCVWGYPVVLSSASLWWIVLQQAFMLVVVQFDCQAIFG